MINLMSSKKITGIYLGSNKIAVAQVAKSITGIKVEKLVETTVEIEKEYDDSDSIMDESSSMKMDIRDQYSNTLARLIDENDIKKDNVVLILPSKDIMVRYFSMPQVPKTEISSTVKFEAKKYIPFNIDEVYSGFHIVNSISSRGNIDVLFSAVKKDFVDKQIDILEKCDITPTSIRIPPLNLLNLVCRYQDFENQKKDATYILLDLNKDIATITIFKSRIPYLVRDFSISSNLENDKFSITDESFENLMHEIHLSLEYFYSQFPSDNISKIYLFNNDMLESDNKIDVLSSEFNVDIVQPDLSKTIKGELDAKNISTELFFAASAAIVENFKKVVNVSLLPKEEKHISEVYSKDFFIPRIIVVEVVALLAGLLVLYVVLGRKMIFSIQEQINSVKADRARINPQYVNMSRNQLLEEMQKITEKKEGISEIFDYDIFLTEKFNRLVINLPRGMWLESLNFINKKFNVGQVDLEINIEGVVFPEGNIDAMDVINSYLRDLKNDPSFMKGFSKIDLTSVRRSQVRDFPVVNFRLRCH